MEEQTTHIDGDVTTAAGNTLPPVVERDRPTRRPLVPRWLLATILAGLAFVGLGVGVATWYVTGLSVVVPDVTELAEGVARTRLAQAGLEVSTVERRFDVQPAGTVLAQDPRAGTRVSRGDGVALVVSAGTEELVMPDVIGLSISVARAQLEQQGLVVRIEAVESEQPVDTVLETIPAAGAVVRTSDVVRVRIATEAGVSTALLPFSLQGAVIVLDPSPLEEAELDVPLEVSRRLRSLLEASGARVALTRTVGEADVDLATRALRASEVTPTVTAVVGLDVLDAGEGGVAVLLLQESSFPEPQQRESATLGDLVHRTLMDSEPTARRASLTSDPVVAATSAPAVRVVLGSFEDRDDIAAFRDPTWSDVVARAIYRALGEYLTQ